MRILGGESPEKNGSGLNVVNETCAGATEVVGEQACCGGIGRGVHRDTRVYSHGAGVKEGFPVLGQNVKRAKKEVISSLLWIRTQIGCDEPNNCWITHGMPKNSHVTACPASHERGGAGLKIPTACDRLADFKKA